MGSSNKGPNNQTITQSNIPKEFMPYFNRLMGRVEAQSLEPYQAYGGQRIAQSGDFADIRRSENLTRDIAGRGIAGLGAAQNAARANIAEAGRLGDYDTGKFSQYGGFKAGSATPFSGFEAGTATPFSGFKAGQASEFDFGDARQFTDAEAKKYMSPYMTNVLDFQKERATEDFDRMRGDRNTRAAQSGAFGGSRQAVQEGLAEENLAKQMQGIDVTGRQAAYEQAAQMFGADRAAQFAQQQAQAYEAARAQGINIGELSRVQQARAAELARTQGINIGEMSRVQQARAEELARTQGISIAEAARIQAAQAAELGRVQTGTEASRQFGAGQGLAALEARGAAAGQLAGFGQQERTAEIQNAQMLDALGRGRQREAQAGMDIRYQDYLRQQGYPQEQLGFYSDVLRGLPLAAAGTQTSTNYQYSNPLQQYLGAGLSGLSLYQAYQ